MANSRIQVKRTSVSGRTPNTTDPSNTHYIAPGEFALNMTDKILYTSDGTDMIAVGAQQVNFQATTIQVSDTFSIGDINTSLLSANSSEVFAGNTSVNTTISTTTITVANSKSISDIDANRIFVGNSVTNAQFNLVGGTANLNITYFTFDLTNGVATFTVDSPHNFVEPIRGTYANLSNMTGPGSVFNGRYEISSAPSPTTFTISNVNFGANIAPTLSASRVKGQAIITTTSNHNFANGSSVTISGVGGEYYGTTTFDGTYTVVNTTAASTTLRYNQYPILTISPSAMVKNAGENYVTYITPSEHGLATGWLLWNVPYPPVTSKSFPTGIPSTPTATATSVNAVAFTSKFFGNETVNGLASECLYLMVDNADVARKIVTTYRQPVTVTTSTYQDIYNFNITNAFLDPTLIRLPNYAGARCLITTDTDVYAASGDFILSNFTEDWGLVFNNKQIQFRRAQPWEWSAAIGSKVGLPSYSIYRCFYITFPPSPVKTISQLNDQRDISASGKIRIPKNLGIASSALATQVYSQPYILQIENVNKSSSVTDYTGSEINWGINGSLQTGIDLTSYYSRSSYVNITWTGNWYERFGSGYNAGDIFDNGVQPLVTFKFGSSGPSLTQFNVGEWIAITTQSYNAGGRDGRDKNTFTAAFQQIKGNSSSGIGFYEIDSVDYNAKTITIKIDSPSTFRYTYYSSGDYRVGYSNTLNVRGVSIRNFKSSSNVNIAVTKTRTYKDRTPITVVNTTAFRMPLVAGEDINTTVYGSNTSPLTIVSGSFTRNTDVAARNPISPPAKVTMSMEAATTGTLNIEYSTYVEVVNSSAAIRVTPSTFYNGNSTVNLFSNSSSLSIGTPTDGLVLSPTEIALKQYSSGKYDASKAHFTVNSTIFHIGGESSKYTRIYAGGKVDIKGSELSIGTEVANIFMNENYLILSSENAQTYISPSIVELSGNLALYGSLTVNGSYGEPGQFLSTDGINLFWSNPLDSTSGISFTSDLTVSGDVLGNSFNSSDTDLNLSTATGYNLVYTANTGENALLTAKSFVISTNIASSCTYANSVTLNATAIVIGNPSVNSTINSTSFTGRANNTLYVGSVAAADVVSSVQLSGNLANYSNTTQVTSNAATAYSNAIVYANNKAANAYSNAVSYVDGKGFVNTSGSYTFTGVHVHTANISVNGSIVLGGDHGSVGQVLTSNGTGNVYWATVSGGGGGSGTLTSVDSANGLAGGPITSTGSLYVLANSGIVSNTSGVFVNTSYISTLSANNASYLGGVAAASYVTATELTNNLANYAAASAITSNAATAYSNAVSYTDTKIGTVNTAITSNAATAYTNATAYASNASNISAGTIAEARLPYRMDQNVRTSDNVQFANLTVTGLIVSGNVTVIGSNNLSISDNMIYLNSNSLVSNPDLGFAGNYNDGTYHHAGFFRDATDGVWKVFDSYQLEPDASQYINTSHSSFHIADLQANTIYIGNTSVYATVNTTNFTGTANNASYLNGVAASSYVNTSAAYTISGVHSYTANLSVNGAIIAGGNSGSSGQVLTSNGSGNVYWSTVSSGGGGFTNGQSISVANLVVTGSLSANGSSNTGQAGYVLTSNGSGVYWGSPAASTAFITRQIYTANGSTNTFTVSSGYTANYLDVYLNGVKLQTTSEVDISSGTTFKILPGNPVNGSIIEVVGLYGSPTVDNTIYTKTFNIVGAVAGQVIGTSRYVPIANSNIYKIRMTNSSVAPVNIVANLKKNGSSLGTYTLPSGNYTQSFSVSHAITTDDYITVDINSGVCNNFSMTISN